MTKKIEETLNLPHIKDLIDVEVNDDITIEDLEIDTSIICTVEDVDGIIEHGKEMEQIYTAAMKAHEDASDLAYNVENRHTSDILEQSAKYLEIAMTASQSKADAKLKALKLKMDIEKMHMTNKKNKLEGVIEEQKPDGSFVANRNDLLAQLRKK